MRGGAGEAPDGQLGATADLAGDLTGVPLIARRRSRAFACLRSQPKPTGKRSFAFRACVLHVFTVVSGAVLPASVCGLSSAVVGRG